MTHSLTEYLREIESVRADDNQKAWFKTLKEKCLAGKESFENGDAGLRDRMMDLFNRKVRTEELKAWYGTREGDSLFQGTSVSSLTIPAVYDSPVSFTSIESLEDEIAEAYITCHDKHEGDVKRAIIEDTGKWRSEGLYYGVVIASKVLSQAFGLSVHHGDVLFSVDGFEVDPHEITGYPTEVREAYFERCREKIRCYEGLSMTRVEFESSLVLSDISKPSIEKYKDHLLLAPVKCNEICTLISRHVCRKIKDKTGGRISPRSLMVTVYDTDTPYTWHRINGYLGHPLSPVLPGLVVLGTSGTIDAFRWLYAYRVSLITQQMMKGSLCSEISGRYMPFVFMGVLVKRDADILLDMDKLGMLRYPGFVSPMLEFCYLLSSFPGQLDQDLQLQPETLFETLGI